MSQPSPSTTRSIFDVPQMDCAAEEQMVRIALDGHSFVKRLEFDLAERRLEVVHEGGAGDVLARLTPLGLGTRLVESRAEAPEAAAEGGAAAEGRSLRVLLLINATMFVIELVTGVLAQSTGLIADSLDMFADAAVYAVSLYAAGRTATTKLRAAHISGWLQLALAAAAFWEVGRNLVLGSEPEAPYMIGVAVLAFAANATCMVLIMKHRTAGAHMRASWIFTGTDVVANFGVIVAGLLVAWTGSRLPDLVIGAIIASVVLTGAVRILRLR